MPDGSKWMMEYPHGIPSQMLHLAYPYTSACHLHLMCFTDIAFSIIRILFTPCISISSAKPIPIL